MVLSVVIIGAAGHYHLVTDELARHPEARLAACAPSFAGEDVTCFSLLGAGAPPRLLCRLARHAGRRTARYRRGVRALRL
jgi:hypothetical protein